MISGIILMLLTGLMWVGIGAVISRAAARRLDLPSIQGCAAVWILVPCLIFLCIRGGVKVSPTVLICLPLAGAGNYVTFLLMKKAMEHGPNGIVWSMTQSAFVFPFVMGILLFGTVCTPVRAGGLILLLISVFLSGYVGKNHSGGTLHRQWIPFALGAFASAGMSQCAANLPSYFNPGGFDSLVLRCGLSQLGTIIMFAGHCLCSGRKPQFRRTFGTSLFFAACTAISALFLLYPGLDLLAVHGAGAIGYPVALGSCILFFYLYSLTILREKLRPAGLGILGLCIGGILLVTIF